MLDRSTIIDTLHATLAAAPFAHAAWLAGSDATGRTDRWSDIDLSTVVDDEHVEDAFGLVERTLEALSPIEIRLRIPQPTWHGFDQAFYRLRDVEPTLMVDYSVMRLSNPQRFLEPERHGTPQILFDRGKIVQPATLDRAALAQRMRARLADLRERFPLFQNLVTKAVHRGSLVEAATSYQMITLRPLVDALRIRYVPERFDFGTRYLQFDLPAGTYSMIEWLATPSDGAGILERQAEAVRLFEETVDDITRLDVIGAFER